MSDHRVEWQKLFHKSVLGVLQQGRLALEPTSSFTDEYGVFSNPNGVCQYRTSSGAKCGVGQLISDEDYTPSMEGKGVRLLEHDKKLPSSLIPFVDELRLLQEAHDAAAYDENHMEGFWNRCCLIAKNTLVSLPEHPIR